MCHLARVLACLLFLTSPALAESRLGGRVSLSTGGDTNPTRDYVAPTFAPDLLASVQASVEGQWLPETRWYAVGAWDGGVRGYLTHWSANTLTQGLSVEAGRRFDGFSLGLDGRAKDRRGGGRDYTDLSAGPFLDLTFGPAVSVRARLGVHRFLYRPLPSETFGALHGSLFARWKLDRRHLLTVSGELGERRFGVSARTETEPLELRRRDLATQAGLAWTYRGTFAAGAGYSFTALSSNSFGQSRVRHRFTVNSGFRVFWESMLFAQAALQLDSYPDGIFLSPEVTLLDDDENTSALTLRWVKPLDDTFDLELRFATYLSRFAESALTYSRQLGTVALTARF